MPTRSHQLIALAFYRALLAFVGLDQVGQIAIAPYRVRLWNGKFREPDVIYFLPENLDRMGEDFSQGADLVVEVVSGSKEDRKRDLQTKRKEYARARIEEYWIIDPQEEQITVLRLSGRKYVVHGKYGRGSQAASWLLDGFEVDVEEVLAGD